MYEQQNNRDRDQKMMFFMQGVPTNKVNMNQLPRWIRLFGYCAFGWMILFSLIMIVGLILQ
ncbi:hypothetical protein COL11_12710 [Bacillus anthracis]|uniref:hypothetical protein n=1 Tax=Bacillus tropicus TaxID=2026188 RepID=UPI000BECFF9F|nr:hypothetical protein [Bacillus tropicus]PEF45621.1 hypothetical protein CON22_15710 [Bacillus cereus]PEZ25799.1 hypothetical protein CN337_03230 [Bacillus anthracis]MDE7553558.1 hypothetical protein [Bacillus tropicus]MDE7570851.1 hypothetical protein [Bacillus tropicus]PFR86142.1 hypothetical protein COK43_24585 [Bacillus cereus]